ncbi:hypothetical protein BH23BAC1_BH23BAC1_42390 [soil metagenome]
MPWICSILPPGSVLKYGKRGKEKLIKRHKFELNDLENDPDELVNLAEIEEYAAVMTDLNKKIKDFQKKTNDPWIHKWDYEKIKIKR